MGTSAKASPRTRRSPHGTEDSYAWLSTRPLHVLVFLAPLIIIYEVGSMMYLVDPQRGMIETIRAWRVLAAFFNAFGAVGLMLPGFALVAVMLTWHIMVRDRWSIRPAVLLTMAMESIVWTVPLLVFAVLFQPDTAAAGTTANLMSLSWPARLTISIGAGLYEELLFRMLVMAITHTIVVSVFRQSDRTARIVAVIASAASFAFYHDVWVSDWSLDALRFLYFLIAGAFFAILYLIRGFGIVVGVHACFDILVLVILPGR